MSFNPEEALLHLERGVELDQSSTHSLWNLALAYLLLGDYAKGWEYYEVRFENDDFEHVTVPTSGPRLREIAAAPRRGTSTSGLVGAGSWRCDSVLPLFESAGRCRDPVCFLTRQSLLTLMRDWTGLGERVQAFNSTDPRSDTRPQVALMSLPRLFGTEIHTVPSICPYLHFLLRLQRL